MTADQRVETDILGSISLPADVLHGVNSVRAIANFPFTGASIAEHREYVRALAQIKAAAAMANMELGLIPPTSGEALVAAAAELAAGDLDAHLVVDVLEGSGGTSTNMNINEVLTNRALQLLGRSPGDYAHLHPNDGANRSQSTNDVIPSAINVACYGLIGEARAALDDLADALERQGVSFADDLRLGRTCLQDAQPMTLGQSFGAYAKAVRRHADTLCGLRETFLVLPLGVTAIGSGFGAAPGYRDLAFEALTCATGVAWRPNLDGFDALSNSDPYTALSACARNAGMSLFKVANDLQFLASGPRGGIGELRLPEVQAGSSIMPGKVNPVTPMAVCQIGFVLTGHDAIVAAACQQGQLEINSYEPVIARYLLSSLKLLRAAAQVFRTQCIEGIEPDRARMTANLMNSSAVATALLPRLGYARVSALVRRAHQRDVGFIEQAEEDGVLSSDEARRLMLAHLGRTAGA